jgi:hypothetical protein
MRMSAGVRVGVQGMVGRVDAVCEIGWVMR